MPRYPHVILLGDTHFPFHHKKTIRKALQHIEKVQPTHVVQMGDLYDFYAYSKFPGPRIMSAGEELRKGRKAAEAWWEGVQERAPRAKCIQIVGNHDLRPLKRMEEKMPELLEFLSWEPIMTFDGVHTHWSFSKPYALGNARITHGAKGAIGRYVNVRPEHNWFIGHLHRSGTVYKEFDGRCAFEHNTGFAGDPSAKCFSFITSAPANWTPGFSEWENNVPRFYATDG